MFLHQKLFSSHFNIPLPVIFWRAAYHISSRTEKYSGPGRQRSDTPLWDLQSGRFSAVEEGRKCFERWREIPHDTDRLHFGAFHQEKPAWRQRHIQLWLWQNKNYCHRHHHWWEPWCNTLIYLYLVHFHISSYLWGFFFSNSNDVQAKAEEPGSCGGGHCDSALWAFQSRRPSGVEERRSTFEGGRKISDEARGQSGWDDDQRCNSLR